MIKRIIILLSFLITAPSFAGELENAIRDNDYVFLYLYTKNCGYCKKFNPVYEKTYKNHNTKYKFVKIDADSRYGEQILRHYRAYYVPYVVLINTKANKNVQVASNCLLSTACINNAVKNFAK